jgi:hypothetical protein
VRLLSHNGGANAPPYKLAARSLTILVDLFSYLRNLANAF